MLLQATQGLYSGLQMTGMIEGFFGLEILDSRIFWGLENLASFFFGDWFK